MTFPVITLEIESMRHSIKKALSEHMLNIDNTVQEAIDVYCSSDNISRIIQTTTRRTIDAVVQEEVEKYFREGEGRKEISALVRELLSKRDHE